MLKSCVALFLFIKAVHTFSVSIVEKSEVIHCLSVVLWNVFFILSNMEGLYFIFQ